MLHLITESENNMINAKVKKFLDNNGLGDRSVGSSVVVLFKPGV